MIQVTLMPHATLKAIFGRDNLNISVPEGSTVGEVLDLAMDRLREDLEKRYGLQRPQDLLQHCILLLNGKHHSKTDALGIMVGEGNRIEIHAPLAGG